MKTIKDVQREIKEVVGTIKELESKYDKKSKSMAKKLRAHLDKLNQYVLFLETAPSKESCERAANKLTDTINRIKDDYASMFGTSRETLTKKKSILKDRGVPKLEQQLNQLKYILN